MGAVMVVEVLGGHRARTRHRIAATGDEAEATVGRSAVCDVVLDDPFVAAVHARIRVDSAGRVTVTDLGSLNGTEVGGVHLRGEPALVGPDGLLRLGRTRLRVRSRARSCSHSERAVR